MALIAPMQIIRPSLSSDFHSALLANAKVQNIWGFESPTGESDSPTSFADLKGSNTLTVTTAGDISVNGSNNQDIASGTDQSMQLCDSSPLMTLGSQPNAAQFSIGFLMKTGSGGGPAATMPYFGNSTFANTRLRYDTTSGLVAAIRIGSTTTVASGYGISWAANTLYFIVVTWDGTTLRLYVNGSQVDSVAPATGGSANWASGPMSWFVVAAASVPSAQRRTGIGGQPNYEADVPSFDDLFLANDDLTSTEVSDLWAVV